MGSAAKQVEEVLPAKPSSSAQSQDPRRRPFCRPQWILRCCCAPAPD